MKKTAGLVLSLGVISAVCSGVLAYINGLTAQPIKEAASAKRIEMARMVMPSGVLTIEEKGGVFVGKDSAGAVAGYALEGADNGGYGGEIVLMVGFKSDRKTVVCYKNLKSSETPGLGSKLSSPEFSSQFEGKNISVLSLKKDGGSVDAITAATITSRAVCKALAAAQAELEKFGK